MNNKITNPKTEVPKGKTLNDKDYLNMTLALLKDMEKNYAISLTEASNENLFAKYEEVFNVIKSLQREVFELAFRKGWYELEKAPIKIKSNIIKLIIAIEFLLILTTSS